MSEILHMTGPGGGVRRARSAGPRRIFFDRSELNQILSLYSRKVIAGEWCDYGIEDGDNEVAFAVYRRNAEAPAYRIVKRRRERDAGYRLVAPGGRIVRMGRSLKGVLSALDHLHPRLI